VYHHVIVHFGTLVQASECLLGSIFPSGQFVHSDPAILTDIYISVTAPHSTVK